MGKKKISVWTVRIANKRLVSKTQKPGNISSNTSTGGIVSFKATYGKKAINFSISKTSIKDAYAKSIAETNS